MQQVRDQPFSSVHTLQSSRRPRPAEVSGTQTESCKEACTWKRPGEVKSIPTSKFLAENLTIGNP